MGQQPLWMQSIDEITMGWKPGSSKPKKKKWHQQWEAWILRETGWTKNTEVSLVGLWSAVMPFKTRGQCKVLLISMEPLSHTVALIHLATSALTSVLFIDPWVGKISWRRKLQPIPAFLPGKSHGQWSLVGYSPWHRKESDTTGWQSIVFRRKMIWDEAKTLDLSSEKNQG